MTPSPKPEKKQKKSPKWIKRSLIKALSTDPRKKLIKELDKVFSEFIRLRDGNKCMMAGRGCNCGGPMQCNHLISRANYRLRWDEKNAVCGCSGHNNWAHNNEADWRELWQKLFPERKEYLMLLKNQTSHYPNSVLILMIREFSRKLNMLNN